VCLFLIQPEQIPAAAFLLTSTSQKEASSSERQDCSNRRQSCGLSTAVSGQLCTQGHPQRLSPRLPSGLNSTEHLQRVPARGTIIHLGGRRCLKQSQEVVAVGLGAGVPNAPVLKTYWKVYGALVNPDDSYRSLLCQTWHLPSLKS